MPSMPRLKLGALTELIGIVRSGPNFSSSACLSAFFAANLFQELADRGTRLG
jgi:hypothetical protein